MKTKFLFPVLAIIFAVGMSFTTAELGEKQANDYIRVNNQWIAISEVDCGSGGLDCRVELQDGSEHVVYDTQSFSSKKDTSNPDPYRI